MSKYCGMTVNERLFEAGLIPEWDQAVLMRDHGKLMELLVQVDLGDQAEKIIESVFRPSK
jgi:hypothetical protein